MELLKAEEEAKTAPQATEEKPTETPPDQKP
jgi:hypothetical protein